MICCQANVLLSYVAFGVAVKVSSLSRSKDLDEGLTILVEFLLYLLGDYKEILWSVEEVPFDI